MKIKQIKGPKIRMRRPRVRIRWRKKTSRWVIGAAVLFFISLFVAQFVLMGYAKSIVQNVLNLQIEQATQGLYSSSFDDIEISYTQNNLIIHNLRLQPQDEAPATSEHEQARVYEITIPRVKINGINLRKAYLQQLLDIRSLELENPYISLFIDYDSDSYRASTILKQDLARLLPASVEELLIKTVRLQDARLKIDFLKNQQRSSVIVSPLFVELHNFQLGPSSTGDLEKIFFTDDFYIEADTITGSLSDATYALSLEALKVSSADSSAYARNIKLDPLKDVPDMVNGSKLRNAYSFDFPQIYLYGLSFADLYHHQDFKAQEITVLGPTLELYQLQSISPGQKESFRIENLYPAIDKVLNSLQVGQLNLSNGQVTIQEFTQNQLRTKLKAGVQNARITDFVLDSAASSNEDKILYSSEIDLKLQNYSLRLSDELHMLEAAELSFSTVDRNIRARDFRVVVDSSSHRFGKVKTYYRTNVPLIELTGVNMLKAYNQNRLSINGIALSDPTLSLLRNQGFETDDSEPQDQVRDRQTNFHEEDLYALIEDYLYTLSIDKINLKQGNLHIGSTDSQGEDAFITQIRSAELWKFSLDSTSAYQMNKLFYAEDFELEIENYEHELPDNIHRISANEIGISTLDDRIYIANLTIRAGNNHYPYTNLPQSDAKTFIDLEIPRLTLDGVDILKAYLYKRLEVERVLIPAPTLQLGSIIENESERTNLIKSSALYDLMDDYMELIDVKELQLQDGEVDLIFYAEHGPLTVSGRHTNLLVDNFRFDSLTSSNPKRLFFADNVQVQVGSYETRLPDDMHIIRAENLMVSTSKQEIQAENVEVSTEKDRYTDDELLVIYQQRGYIRLALPRLMITGLNFDKAYYDEELYIDTVYASDPQVAYTYVPKSALESSQRRIKIKQTDFYEAISPYLQSFALESLVVEGGRFTTYKQQNSKIEDQLLLDGISLQMHDFLADSATVYNSQRFLYANDISLQIERYRQQLLDRVHVLSAQSLELSTSNQSVQARNIFLKPKENSLEEVRNSQAIVTNRFHIALPELRIQGIAFDEVYRNDRLYIRELLLSDPNFKINHYVNSSASAKDKRSKNRNYNLHELIRGNLLSVTVDSASIRQGAGEYYRVDENGVSRFQSKNFKASVHNFHIEGEENNDDRLFYADDVRLLIKDYERRLADSLHILRVDELKLSSQDRKLSLSGLELRPRLDINYQKRMQEQGSNKLYHVKVPLCELQDISVEQLQQDSLLMRKLLVKNPEIELIRFTGQEFETKEQETATVSWKDRLPEGLRLVKSDSISLQNATIAYTTISDKDSSTFRIGNIDGLATAFKLDSLTEAGSEKMFYADRLQFQVKDYKTNIDNDLYELQIRDVHFDSQERSLVADSILITPLVDRETFAQTKGYETDQFTFRNHQLTIQNIDYPGLIRKGHLNADSLLFDGFNLLVYRDKRQPYPEDYHPKMPQELIRNLGIPVFLKGMAIKNGYIGYSERARGTREEGFIDLTNLQVVSDTISNYPELLKRGLSTNISLNCYLMGTGRLQAYFDIPLGDTLNRHTYWGTLDEMSLEDFNPILEKTVFVKIRSGFANQINFYVEADRNSARGTMEFRYQGLKVALVNKRTGNTGGVIKELGSFVANMFVINTNNTEKDDKPLRKGEIAFVRDDRRSVVNYWVKTLVDGFKSSIGM